MNVICLLAETVPDRAPSVGHGAYLIIALIGGWLIWRGACAVTNAPCATGCQAERACPGGFPRFCA